MWLVFHDEGMSLRHYLYTEREAKGFVLHGQSNFWRDMRLDPKGPEVGASFFFFPSFWAVTTAGSRVIDRVCGEESLDSAQGK